MTKKVKTSDSTKRKNFGFFVALGVLVCFLIFFIALSYSPKKEITWKQVWEQTWEQAGVVIIGRLNDEGILENTNDFPVRIKCVLQGKGERTLWIRVLEPDQRIRVALPLPSAFYIITLEEREASYMKLKLPKIVKPIFVIGCCNSGTTVLQHALLRHDKLDGPMIDDQDLGKMPPIMTHHLCNDTFRMWAHPKYEMCYYYTEKDYDQDDAAQLNKIYSSWLDGDKRLVAKSPAHTYRARLIQAYYPDARFIAIVRNGYAVAEGIRRKRKCDLERPQYEGLFTTIEDAALQWFYANVAVLSMQKFLKRYLIIRYEDLVGNPKRVMKNVLAFCGLEIGDYTAPRFDRERNKEQIKYLSRGEREVVTKVAKLMLIHFGYKILTGELKW